MLKVSDSVSAIINANPPLRLGLAQRLMNLTQLARHIHPAVEARTKKSVQIPAIAMALSRLQASLTDPEGGTPLMLAEKLTVQRGLTVLTLPNTARCHEGLIDVQRIIRAAGGYLTITEGIREITLITDAARLELVRDTVREKPIKVVGDIASISVSLTAEHVATPGILYRFLQPLALQGIAVAEVASTTSEFHVYLADQHVMLALDALYGAFGRKASRGSTG